MPKLKGKRKFFVVLAVILQGMVGERLDLDLTGEDVEILLAGIYLAGQSIIDVYERWLAMKIRVAEGNKDGP